jgi:hypothetical protein
MPNVYTPGAGGAPFKLDTNPWSGEKVNGGAGSDKVIDHEDAPRERLQTISNNETPTPSVGSHSHGATAGATAGATIFSEMVWVATGGAGSVSYSNSGIEAIPMAPSGTVEFQGVAREAGNVELDMYFAMASGDAAKNVCMRRTYLVAGSGTDPDTVLGNQLDYNITPPDDANYSYYEGIAVSGITAKSLVKIKLQRMGAPEGDTHVANLNLIELRIH